jgi:hypothetical protein
MDSEIKLKKWKRNEKFETYLKSKDVNSSIKEFNRYENKKPNTG